MSENPVFKQWEAELKGKLEKEKQKINEFNRGHLQNFESLNNKHSLRYPKLIQYTQGNETLIKKKSVKSIYWKPKFPKNFDTLKHLKSGDCSKYIKSCFKAYHNRYYSNNANLDFNMINNQVRHNKKTKTNFNTVIWEDSNNFDEEDEYEDIKLGKSQNHIDLKKIKLRLSEASPKNSLNLSIAEKKKRKQEKWKKIAKNIKDYRRNHSLLGENLDSQATIHSVQLPSIHQNNPKYNFCKAKTLQTTYINI